MYVDQSSSYIANDEHQKRCMLASRLLTMTVRTLASYNFRGHSQSENIFQKPLCRRISI